MKRRITAVFLAAVLCFALVLVTSAQGGSSSDPVVSKSYVDGTFFESLISAARNRIESSVSSFKNKYINAAQSAASVSSGEKELVAATADAVLRDLQSRGRYLYSTRAMTAKTLRSGDVVSGRQGMIFMVKSGYARCTSGKVINITKGTEAFSPCGIGNNTAYMFPENGGSIEIITKDAEILIDGVYSVSAYKPKYTDEAYAMKKLGLVRGAANGMELYRGNTRAESITMLIRLLGEEDPALSAAHRPSQEDLRLIREVIDPKKLFLNAHITSEPATIDE